MERLDVGAADATTEVAEGEAVTNTVEVKLTTCVDVTSTMSGAAEVDASVDEESGAVTASEETGVELEAVVAEVVAAGVGIEAALVELDAGGAFAAGGAPALHVPRALGSAGSKAERSTEFPGFGMSRTPGFVVHPALGILAKNMPGSVLRNESSLPPPTTLIGAQFW